MEEYRIGDWTLVWDPLDPCPYKDEEIIWPHPMREGDIVIARAPWFECLVIGHIIRDKPLMIQWLGWLEA